MCSPIRPELRSLPCALFATTLALVSIPSLAAQSTLVDINQTPGLVDIDSDPTGFTTVGSSAWFAAYTVAEGEEPWLTTGTSRNTRIRADLNPGAASSTPREFTVVGDSVYFVATRSDVGRELWKSVRAGTPQLVADIYRGPLSSSPSELTLLDDQLYFSAQLSGLNRELVRLDTTTDQFTRIEVRPGRFGSDPRDLVAMYDSIAFSANDGVHGREPFLTSPYGSTDTVFLIGDINPGPAGSDPEGLVSSFEIALPPRDVVYFAATDPSSGRELWRFNRFGTLTRLYDHNPGPASSNPFGIANVFNGICFVADDGSGRNQLWVAGQQPLPVTGMPFGSILRVQEPVRLQSGQTVYLTFLLETRSFTGAQAEQLVFFDLFGQAATSFGPFRNPRSLTAGPDRVYFLEEASDPEQGSRVRTFAPTNNTDTFTTDAPRPSSELANGPGYLLLGTDSSQSDGIEPHRLAYGTSESLTLLAEANPGAGTRSSSPEQLVALPQDSLRPDGVAFRARSGRTIRGALSTSLFVSDGTPSGTNELFPGDGTVDAAPADLVAIGDAVWFTAATSAHGRSLYRSRGGNPERVPSPSDPRHLADFRGSAWFTVRTGNELWTALDAQAPARLVHTMPFGSITGIFARADELLFLLQNGTTTELWKTDGRQRTPTRLALLNRPFLPIASFQVSERTVITSSSGLLASNGSALGTALLPVTLGSAAPRSFALFNQRLYFVGDSTQHGRELWVTDGTSAGTRRISDIALRTSDGIAEGTALAATAEGVFFAAENSPLLGRELWLATGPSSSQVRRITDLAAGAPDGVGLVAAPIGISQRIALAAGANPDGSPDLEFFVSDGTAGGTVRIEDIQPGTRGSAPRSFTTAGNRLFFVADDGFTGEELRSIALRDLEAPSTAPYGSACATPGTPAPDLSLVGRPNLGTTFQLRVPVDRAGQPVLAWIGIAPTAAPLGGGCALLTTQDLAIPGSSGSAAAEVAIPVPTDPNLLGASLYAQMARVLPAGPAFGVADLSGGFRLVIGRR